MNSITLNQVAKAANVIAIQSNRDFTMSHIRSMKNAIHNGDYSALPSGLLEELNITKESVLKNAKSQYNGKNAAKCLKLWCVEKRGRTVKMIELTRYKRWMFDKWFAGQAISEDVWSRLIIAIKQVESKEFDLSFNEMWGGA